MDSKTIEQLRKIEIELLDFVVDTCKRENIHYFLLYGTLLGAVRHKGFIPWDDDIDIGLFRSDYDSLCKALRKACRGSKLYYFQEFGMDDDFKAPFVKIRKRGTLFLESQEYDKKKEQGIFIDIFPLDKVRHKYGIQKLISFAVYKLLKIAKNKKSFTYRIANKLVTMFEHRNCKYLVSYGSPYPVDRDVMETIWFDGEKSLEFEGKKYSVPKQYNKYLESIYGNDYMALPPESKRVTHNPKLIKFE